MHASQSSHPLGRVAVSLALTASLALVAPCARAQAVYATTGAAPPGQASARAAASEPIYEGPRILRYEEGDPVPPGYYVVEKPATGLIVGGAILFGSLYGISLLVAAGNTDDTAHGQRSPADALYIPVIGPFAQMTRSNNSAVGNVFLGIDGFAQAGGVLMLIAGLTTTRLVLTRGAAQGTTRAPRFTASPMVGRGMSGVGVVGTF